MFRFGKKKDEEKKPESSQAPAAPEQEPVPVAPQPQTQSHAVESNDTPAKVPLRERLKKTRRAIGEGLATMFVGPRQIDDEFLEELETLLLSADVGIDATTAIIDDLTQRVKRKELSDADALMKALRQQLADRLAPYSKKVMIGPQRPFVILMIGVNGAGKTTTIGKLTRRLMAEGHSVLLAAGDTFRAAAVEQLQAWGERNKVAVIAQRAGADPAAVIHDALSAAKARQVDVVIADTAGRLHTQSNLMDELAKVRRVINRFDPEAPHETLLVVDGGTGQNAVAQAKQFNQAAPLSGVVVTKLDGTAKGGVIFALTEALKLPVRMIGVGESAEDLRDFDPVEFAEALLPDLPPGNTG